MNIYVSNLGASVSDAELKNFFTPFGEVSSAKVIMDRESGMSRGFGFVEMSDDNAARKAISELANGLAGGKNMKVSEARPKEQRSFKSNSPFKSDYR